MDQVKAMKVFVRIYERGSFTRAAEDLEMPRATLTHTMNQLETWLGTRLLERSTRRVRPTEDGEAYYGRCVQLLSELEEAAQAFRSGAPSGRLRVDMHGTLAKFFVIPALPDFLARHPEIALNLSESDRLVDLIEEGVDCVLRAGTPSDSSLIRRRLADLPQVTCASPAYLSQFGTPRSIDDLVNHRAVNYHPKTAARCYPFEFTREGKVRQVEIPGSVTVFGAEIYAASALAGLGLIQVPRYRVAAQIEQGLLCEVMMDSPPPPMPISVFYPRNRILSKRVRVFVDWLVERFEEA